MNHEDHEEERPTEERCACPDAADPAASRTECGSPDGDVDAGFLKCCQTIGDGGDAFSACPMSAMFEGMAGKVRPGLAYLLLIPALILLALGALIIIEPVVLVWLAGGVFALIGLALLGITFAVRRFLGSLRNA
ncbi:MAG: hypothetical protein ACYTG6_08460 [Planctomycetota bacterium]|jgi:hypothetical protein